MGLFAGSAVRQAGGQWGGFGTGANLGAVPERAPGVEIARCSRCSVHHEPAADVVEAVVPAVPARRLAPTVGTSEARVAHHRLPEGEGVPPRGNLDLARHPTEGCHATRLDGVALQAQSHSSRLPSLWHAHRKRSLAGAADSD